MLMKQNVWRTLAVYPGWLATWRDNWDNSDGNEMGSIGQSVEAGNGDHISSKLFMFAEMIF
jgi:hypothetical protein